MDSAILWHGICIVFGLQGFIGHWQWFRWYGSNRTGLICKSTGIELGMDTDFFQSSFIKMGMYSKPTKMTKNAELKTDFDAW